MSARGPAGSAPKRAAKRPAPRFVTVALNGQFSGWELTARADFPARVLMDLQSGDIERTMAALDGIVTEHNFPDGNDDVASSLADVVPFEAIGKAVEGITAALGKLPNR